jgi:membrane protease YdiL (CAAX protease family)
MKSRVVDAVLYFVVFLLIQFVVTWAVYMAWQVVDGKSWGDALQQIANGNAVTTAPMLVVVQAVASLVSLVLFLALRWCVVSPSYLRSRPYGVLFWAAVAAIGTIIPSEVFLELVPLPDVSGEVLRDVMDNQWGYWAICIFAPLVEELVFRGAILRALLDTRLSRVMAIAVSAMIFALAHGNPAQMPHAFCMGLLLGWMYERTRSIIPGIMLHWVNNTVAFAVFRIFPQYRDVRVIDLLGGDYAKVGMALLFSLLVLLPALFQLHQRMKRAS